MDTNSKNDVVFKGYERDTYLIDAKSSTFWFWRSQRYH